PRPPRAPPTPPSQREPPPPPPPSTNNTTTTINRVVIFPPLLIQDYAVWGPKRECVRTHGRRPKLPQNYYAQVLPATRRPAFFVPTTRGTPASRRSGKGEVV